MSPAGRVSVAQLDAYLLTHQAPTTLEFLARDGALWLVRWPAGNVRWESEESLKTRGFAVPARAILDEHSPACADTYAPPEGS